MIIVLTLSLSGCSSQKKMVENPPFELGTATCQSWTGGRVESGSGLLLQIPVLSENLDNMKLQQAYFRGKIADLKLKSTDNGWVAESNFITRAAGKPDMTMHADAKQEVGNQPPMPKEKFPFELENNQCVLSYLDGDTVKYFKVEGIKEKKPVFYK